MKYTERMVRGDVASDHIVQLFDGPETLVESVATYVTDGLLEGSTLLVVMSATHWDRVLTRLDASDISVPDALASGSLVVLDAAAALAQLMRNGAPDAERFDARVGALVRRLVGRGRPLRVYGEMVDILAARGDFRLAQELEALWNTFGEHTRFTLFLSSTPSGP